MYDGENDLFKVRHVLCDCDAPNERVISRTNQFSFGSNRICDARVCDYRLHETRKLVRIESNRPQSIGVTRCGRRRGVGHSRNGIVVSSRISVCVGTTHEERLDRFVRGFRGVYVPIEVITLCVEVVGRKRGWCEVSLATCVVVKWAPTFGSELPHTCVYPAIWYARKQIDAHEHR